MSAKQPTAIMTGGTGGMGWRRQDSWAATIESSWPTLTGRDSMMPCLPTATSRTTAWGR